MLAMETVYPILFRVTSLKCAWNLIKETIHSRNKLCHKLSEHFPIHSHTYPHTYIYFKDRPTDAKEQNLIPILVAISSESYETIEF